MTRTTIFSFIFILFGWLDIASADPTPPWIDFVTPTEANGELAYTGCTSYVIDDIKLSRIAALLRAAAAISRNQYGVVVGGEEKATYSDSRSKYQLTIHEQSSGLIDSLVVLDEIRFELNGKQMHCVLATTRAAAP